MSSYPWCSASIHRNYRRQAAAATNLEHAHAPPEHKPVSRYRAGLGLFGGAVCVAIVVVVVTGIRAREQAGEKLREWTDDQAVPTVAVTAPDAKAGSPTSTCRDEWKPTPGRPSSPASRAI